MVQSLRSIGPRQLLSYISVKSHSGLKKKKEKEKKLEHLYREEFIVRRSPQ